MGADLAGGPDPLDLPEGACVLRRLGSGPVTDSWLLARGNERLVLRRDRPLAGRLGLDREREWTCLQVAHARDLGPEPLFHDPARGVLLTRYLPAASGTLVPGKATWERLGRLLGAVHALPKPDVATESLERTAIRYARLAGSALAARRARDIGRWARALEMDAPLVLCHRDPHLGNVVWSEDVRLIDWEYAAPGDPRFDLAVVIRAHALDAGDARRLVAAWCEACGRPSPGPLEKVLRLYRSLERLWWEAVNADLG